MRRPARLSPPAATAGSKSRFAIDLARTNRLCGHVAEAERELTIAVRLRNALGDTVVGTEPQRTLDALGDEIREYVGTGRRRGLALDLDIAATAEAGGGTGRRPFVAWLVRWRIAILAGVTFIVAVASAAVAADSFTARTIRLSALIGALLALPLVFESQIWVSRRSDRADANPATSPPPGADTRSPTLDRPTFPMRTSSFRGRRAELELLVATHNEERTRARSHPVMLSIHGMPRVGKTELAKQLARELESQYPDGYVLTNFGTAGYPRPPAEIVKEILVGLGWPEDEIPADADGRLSLLRTVTTGRRYVFIFDAVRFHDQVRKALPAEPSCAVIITSRRDFASALELPPSCAIPLGVPSAQDALEMLGGAARSTGWPTPMPRSRWSNCVAGSQPPSRRRANESRRVRRYETWSPCCDRGRLGSNGLTSRSGKCPKELSASSAVQPDSTGPLCLLSLVESRTFVPWVLRPMLGISEFEAEVRWRPSARRNCSSRRTPIARSNCHGTNSTRWFACLPKPASP